VRICGGRDWSGQSHLHLCLPLIRHGRWQTSHACVVQYTVDLLFARGVDYRPVFTLRSFASLAGSSGLWRNCGYADHHALGPGQMEEDQNLIRAGCFGVSLTTPHPLKSCEEILSSSLPWVNALAGNSTPSL